MRTKLFAFCCVLAVLSGCAGQSTKPVHPSEVRLKAGGVVNGTMSDFQRALAARKGTPVVVNFWASWCIPCRTEMPLLVKAAADYRNQIDFLGINVRDDLEAANAFAKKAGVTYPSIGDPDGKIMGSEKVVGLPVTKFYRPDGKLAFVSSGELSEETLNKQLTELVRVSQPVD